MGEEKLNLDANGRAVIKTAVVGGYKGFIAYHHDAGMFLANQLSEKFDNVPIVFETVASALHINPDMAIEGGKRRGIERVYRNHKEMIEGEMKLPLEERAVAVSIRLPQTEQHQVVMDCLDAGLHVVVDKPNAAKPSDAWAQYQLAQEKGLVGVVTFSYAGSPMVREMKNRVAQNGIEKLTAIHGMYPQGWIIGLGKDKNFRLQYKAAGGFGVSADLGATHTLTDMEFVSGLSVQKLTANLRTIANHPDPAQCSEVDNYGQALIELGDGKSINVLGTAYWSQVAASYGNDHELRVDGLDRSYRWVNSAVPGLSSEVLLELKDGQYIIIPRDPNGGFLSAEALRGCKAPGTHGEGFDHWFAGMYREAGVLIAEKVYGIAAPKESAVARTLEHGARSLFYLYKLTESHAKGGVPVDAKFDPAVIPALESFVNEHYLAKIAPKER